jgi:predicted transcriptional regulator
MTMSRVKIIIEFLSGLSRDQVGDAWTTGTEILKGCNFSAADINDAIEVAENRGWVKTRKYLGTTPYKFGGATITPEGRLFLEKD